MGGKTQSTAAREIEIDVSDVPYGEPFSIVIQATIWNGFQVNDDRKQWAALLSLDNLGEAELGIRFPENMRPKKQPRLWVYPRGSEKAEAPSELQNFTVLSNSNGWVWRPHDVKRNFVYQFEFDWDYPTDNLSDQTGLKLRSAPDWQNGIPVSARHQLGCNQNGVLGSQLLLSRIRTGPPSYPL